MMKIGSVSLVLAVICGCVPMDQTNVGGSAREKCLDAGITNADVDSLFVLIETAKEDGASKGETLSAVGMSCNVGCDDATCQLDCFNCNVAIIDEVYDNQ